MTDDDLRTNPDALAQAPPPRIGRKAVNGTILYSEVRGSGPAVLLIHAGGEDAEEWRPIAERLTGFTVVTYDRRGTLRSGRNDWPGRGSAQHADDAAGLLDELGLGDVLVFGGSAGLGAAQAESLRSSLHFATYLRSVAASYLRPVISATCQAQKLALSR